MGPHPLGANPFAPGSGCGRSPCFILRARPGLCLGGCLGLGLLCLALQLLCLLLRLLHLHLRLAELRLHLQLLLLHLHLHPLLQLALHLSLGGYARLHNIAHAVDDLSSLLPFKESLPILSLHGHRSDGGGVIDVYSRLFGAGDFVCGVHHRHGVLNMHKLLCVCVYLSRSWTRAEASDASPACAAAGGEVCRLPFPWACPQAATCGLHTPNPQL